MFVVLGNISAYTLLIYQIVIQSSLSISHKLTGHDVDGLVIFFIIIIATEIYCQVESKIIYMKTVVSTQRGGKRFVDN